MCRKSVLTIVAVALLGGFLAMPADGGPVRIFIMAGQSNMEGHGEMNPIGTQGTLEYIYNDDPVTYGHLKDGSNWAVLDDVWIWYMRGGTTLVKGGLTAGYGAYSTTIGPELQFGHTMSDFYGDQVLLIKTAWGGKSLAVDFRPPSSGWSVNPPVAEGDQGYYYQEMMNFVADVQANIGTYFPGYSGQGYEIIGFAWHQGWNDRVTPSYAAEYEQNMENFIKDVRFDLARPDMPFVIATTGMDGTPDYSEVELAQLAMENYTTYPEFEGNVTVIDTQNLWQPVAASPADQVYHWNRNAKTYYMIGDAIAGDMTTMIDPNPPVDTTAPTPNPMTWSSVPAPASASSITMTATLATDNLNGVLYKFTCTAGGGHSSLWQASNTYTDTGLLPQTQYTYTVTARDTSAAQNTTTASSAKSATTDPDYDPPTPNPATFASAPAWVSSSQITMTATTGSDDSLPIQYYFDETTGHSGGTDSGWTTNPVYSDTGLSPQTQYTYTVQMRDPWLNTGTASSPASATTPEGNPPTPNPATFATPPTAISDTQITMTATTGTDATGPVQYYFNETTGRSGGTDSGWTTNPVYYDKGLSPNTQYTYTVQMRDSIPNTGTASSPANATTYSLGSTTVTITNSGFETMYKPNSTTITASITDWTQGVGPDCPIDSGVYTFSDQTTGTLGDIPGWLGYDKAGWIALGGTYGRDQTTGNLQGSVSTGNNHTPSGVYCYLSNGGDWGNPAGGLITSAASLGNIQSGSIYTLSMYANGSATPIVLNLLANGTVLTPTFSMNPTLSGDHQEFFRTYNEASLSSYVGQALTVVCGLGRNASGTQSHFDDVSLEYYGYDSDTDPPTPNPATFASAPAAVSSSQITMTATTGADATGPVEYYFDETTGHSGGSDSGWTTNPVYNDTGLSASTQYTYTVEMRDALLNTGTASSPASATTPALQFVAAGAVKSGTGAISPALPSGIAVNDILLLFVETANQAVSISNQNGGTWAEVTGSPQGTGTAGGTAATRLTVFWSRYNGTQGAPTVSDSGNHQLARMVAIRGAVSSGDPWNVTAGGVEATSDTSASIPGATTTVANTLVVVATAGSLPDASGTAQFSAWTNANLTSLTERTDNSVNAGNGGSLGIATGIKATAGAYGNTAVTHANSAVKGMISIAIKP